jgi:hypothetical protein
MNKCFDNNDTTQVQSTKLQICYSVVVRSLPTRNARSTTVIDGAYIFTHLFDLG